VDKTGEHLRPWVVRKGSFVPAERAWHESLTPTYLFYQPDGRQQRHSFQSRLYMYVL